MLPSRLARKYMYERIHKYVTDENYRNLTKLEELIDEGRRWECKLKEYLELYPQDKDL